MKKKIVLKRIFHKENWRIAYFFDYDEMLKEKVKSIPGSAFSITNRCFYTDDTEENLKVILGTFKEIADVDISAISFRYSISKAAEGHLSPPARDDESDEVNQHGMVTTITDDSGDLPSQETLDHSGYGPVEFRINEKGGLLVIKFLGRYDSVWIDEMKSYCRCRYDKRKREWLLDWTKLTTDSLADYFSERGIKVNVVKAVVDQGLQSARDLTGEEIRAKQLGKEALDGLDSMAIHLDENRYSPRTRESYLAALEFFFRYISPRDPSEISQDDISLFIYEFIIKLGYSASYQNQMVSAIKIYYTISGRRKVNPQFFERPRRSRALPKVFSKEEVVSILNSARNVKHKLLLWMIYSCGLRRTEVTNIKLTDLDRERGIVHIREGKGKVDRFVPLPQKVWDKVEEYFVSYRPKVFLFEGQAGGRYSSESVYRVFKDAMKNAGISKDVGVHSLRHSYATHLHENGLDIRYIQELLGHKSTRTTEIYTHVSRRNLVQVRSPIEDLNVK
jgi:integrase/recombinase XerD